MLLAEALSPEEFRQRVKIYATDVDEDALSEARAATFDARDVESVEPALLEKYFERVANKFVFRKNLRRAVIFGRNDLVRDAPISRVDLLVCRNTLMNLNAETQRNVLGRQHFALAPQGVLFLGHAEMLLSHSDRFTPLELTHRIFQRLRAPTRWSTGSTPRPRRWTARVSCPVLAPLRELAFRASPVAQIVVTGEDTVAMINQQAEQTFGLSARDIGRLLRDLEISYRPVELRAYV